jgi:hypothetical protein
MRWRADGKELVYMAADSTAMSVSIQATATGIVAGTPTPLFRASSSIWDMTRDAQRFLIAESPEGDRRSPVVVLLIWQENLKR